MSEGDGDPAVAGPVEKKFSFGHWQRIVETRIRTK